MKKQIVKPKKVKLKEDHKGHDVVKIRARRRVMFLCRTCDIWVGAKMPTEPKI